MCRACLYSNTSTVTAGRRDLSPRDTHCSPSSEMVLQMQTISLAAHSMLLLPAQAPSTFIFLPAFNLSLFAVLKVTDLGKLFISYTAPVIIHQEFGRLTAGHTHTSIDTKSLHEHVIGFPGCGAILKCCCVCHFGIKLM